jgi:hypothetical protein
MNKITIIVEKTNTGFSAYAQDYDFVTTGIDWETLQYNILEAANLYFEDQGINIQLNDLDLILEMSEIS